MSESELSFIDCNGLAGFLSLGFVQNGMSMLARTGTLNFGNVVAESNRHLLGNNWEPFFSDNPDEWPQFKAADIVVGCPPCSGWSVWSGPTNRGADAKAHEHTTAFMQYVGKIAPKVAIFECVQQAYSQGKDAMLGYRTIVEDISSKKYDLYHVKHNNLQLGGFSYRPRYFWVIVRTDLNVKLRVPISTPESIPTIMDVIGDLKDLPHQWEAQEYQAKAHSSVKHLLSKSGKVDGHIGKSNIHTQRVHDVFEIIGNEGWHHGDNLGKALKKAVMANDGEFPASWHTKMEKIVARDFYLGFSQPYRWREDSWCNVLTGSALNDVVHPTEPRLITHREAARVQGLPDDWDIENSKNYSPLQATWGKAVAVQPSVWIAKAVKAMLTGNSQEGEDAELIGDREYLINGDRGFSRHAARQLYFPEDTKK